MNGVPDHPELLLRERAWLHALARQLVQPHEGADELAHDTLTAAMTQGSPRTAGLRGWLAAILKKQLAGRRRAEHRRRARETFAARSEALPATFDTVARFEVQRDVGSAVLALSEPYRTTVLLRYWEDLSPLAISHRMHVPVETVRTRLKRGLAQLRERLDRAHGGDRQAWLVPLGAVLQPAAAATSPFFLFAGISLMAAWSKFVVGGIASAVAVWLLVTSPWSPPVDAVPTAGHRGAAAATAASGELAELAAEPPVRRDAPPVARATAPDQTDAAWLVVTGSVVDDATDAPLPGVPVRLVSWPARGADLNGITGPDGTFTLQDTGARGHEARQVVVLATDYAAARADVRFAAKSEGCQTIDVGAIHLVRGTLFSGQVVDQDGHGVADAELLLPLVYVSYSPSRGPQNMLQGTASLGHADAGGRFRLEQPVAPDIQHGNLLFAIAARGIGWCRFEPSKQRREIADVVIRLRPNGAVRVFVEDPNGRAFAGALVRALPRFGPFGLASSGWREEVSGPEAVRAWFVGRTDARGELLLPQLPAGEPDKQWNAGAIERDYELWVQADGHPTQVLQPFQLQPGTEQRLVVRLVGAREVAVSVLVRDDLGAPIGDAVVSVGGASPAEGRTDAAGHVELAVGAVPTLSVSATCPGHLRAHSQLDVGPGVAALHATLVLARTLAFDGRLVDQTGAAVVGMNLFVDQRMVGSSDAEGRFHVDEFPMGSRRIIVALGSNMDACQWTGGQEPKDVDAAQGPVTIVMQRRLGSIDVRIAIVDAATGAALEAVEASLRLQHAETGLFFFPKRTQTELALVTAKGTPAGRWQLGVRTATGQRGSLEFTLTDGQLPVDLRLELPAPGTITGRLQFVGVLPPATVTVAVRHATVVRAAVAQFRYPGRWRADPTSQFVVDAQHGHVGLLRLQPAQNASFQLDSADPTDDLVFTVRGEGITGEARLRIEPGQTRELVIEVRAKGQ